jgi:hypothetical protein
MERTDTDALVLGATGREPIGIEAQRVAPPFRHEMRVQWVDHDHGPGGDLVPVELDRARRHAGDGRERRVQAERLVDDTVERAGPSELVIAESLVASSAAFVAHAGLPLGMARELVHQRAERAGGGVVGGHHQEDQVIDDLRGRGNARPPRRWRGRGG